MNKILFIDVGTCRGSEFSSAMKIWSNMDFLLIEPNPKNYQFLLKKFGDNKKISMWYRAVSNKTGVKKIYVRDIDGKEYTDGTTFHNEIPEMITSKQKKVFSINTISTTDLLLPLKDKYEKIILHLNCVGGEFDIIEDILHCEECKDINLSILVRFYHHPQWLNCPQAYKSVCKGMELDNIHYVEHRTVAPKITFLEGMKRLMKEINHET